jgi:hypothetical protein
VPEKCGHVAGKPTSDTLNFEVYWDYTGEEELGDEFCWKMRDAARSYCDLGSRR